MMVMTAITRRSSPKEAGSGAKDEGFGVRIASKALASGGSRARGSIHAVELQARDDASLLDRHAETGRDAAREINEIGCGGDRGCDCLPGVGHRRQRRFASGAFVDPSQPGRGDRAGHVSRRQPPR